MATLFFLLLIALLGSTYVGYPVVVHLLSRRAKDEPSRRNLPHSETPEIDLVLPVHNEERNLPAKLQNIFELDYPSEKLQVYVVSDGSSDSTNDILSNVDSANDGFHVILLPEQNGKEAALNVAVGAGRNPLIVFTDASLMMQPDCLQHFAKRFSNPEVGCVSGEDFISGQQAEGLYGRYELALRRNESKLFSIVGASGCLYAQKRLTWRPFTPGYAPDFSSVLDAVDLGYRAVCEPGARGYMQATSRHGGEFRRKCRTILRGIATLWAYRRMLNPARNGTFSILLWGHKVMRWLVPIWLIALLIVSFLLSSSMFFAAILIAQCAFYIIGGLASTRGSRLQKYGIPRLASYFTISNAAAMVAIFKWVAGEQQTSWKPTNR